MKLPTTLFILILGISLSSCKAKKMVEPSEEELQNVLTMDRAFVKYYKIEKVDGEEVWIEKSVKGFPDISVDQGKELMTIALSESGEKIICERRTHPVSRESVFLQIGDTSETRER